MMADTAATFRRPVSRPRLPVGGAVAFMLGVLLLAGIVHIVAILLVPVVARADGWSRLAPFAGEEEFAEIPTRGEAVVELAGFDPLFVNAACRINLRNAPASITVEARDRFWSLGLYDPRGTIIFSLNDRTVVNGRLDMLVVTPAQNAAVRNAANLDQTIVVVSPAEDLVAILRMFAPNQTAQEQSRQVLRDSECLSSPVETLSGLS